MSFLAELNVRKKSLKSTQTTVTYTDGSCYIETGRSALPIKTDKRPYGYVVDNKPDDKPAKILEYLFLGSQDCCTKEVLEEHNILHVLSIGCQTSVHCDGISYNFIDCLDLPETNIWDVVKSSVLIIRNCLNKCENLLIHCNAGVSRSASVIIGYLITDLGYDYVTAFKHVKTNRSCIRPNDGFIKQLENHHICN